MKSVCPKTKHFVLLLGLLIPSVVLRGQSDEELAFFEERIRPVLAGKCYACHSQQAPILMGGLQVDTREGIRGETNSGYGVIPYEPAQSLILKALRYDSSPKMPPDGKLPDNVIRDLVKWIEMGAPDPRGEPMEPTTEHRAVEADAKGAADHWA